MKLDSKKKPIKNKIIHVNQQIIRQNVHKKAKDRLPIFRMENNGKTIYAEKIDIIDKKSKQVIASFEYRPDKPLKCGAKCYVTTKLDVKLTKPTTFREMKKNETRT